LTTPAVARPLNRQWETAIAEAIRTGNGMHDELFGGEGIDVAVEDAITAPGEHSHVGDILHEYNLLGVNPTETVIPHFSGQ